MDWWIIFICGRRHSGAIPKFGSGQESVSPADSTCSGDRMLLDGVAHSPLTSMFSGLRKLLVLRVNSDDGDAGSYFCPAP